MRRLPLLVLLAAAFVSFHSIRVDAQGSSPVPARPLVEIVKIEGIIDPSVSAYVRGTIEDAERSAAAVVLQVDSRGSFEDEAVKLGRHILAARVPVVAWVGPAAARAEGGALFLLYSSSLVAMAPGAGVGPARPFDLGTTPRRENQAEASRLSAELLSFARGSGARPEGVRRLLRGEALAAKEALQAGAVSVLASRIIGGPAPASLLRELHGRSLRTGAGPVHAATLDGNGDLAVQVRFHDLGPLRRIFHAVSTPTAVYVLLVLGLWGLAFELTQPGIGLAGIGGALFVALAGYGLTVIPVNWAGLALVLGGTGLMALDVLVRRVGLLTVAGAGVFAAGSILSWWGVAAAVDVPLWLVALFTLAGALFFGFALTVALKAKERVQSAQMGLIGLLGEARGDIDPEGAVFVKGTLWRARSMDGRIPKGKRVRIRGIDGLILRVEEEPE